MHAHERTLLARLGFADPDRREPLHDIACRYLAQDHVARQLAGFFDLEYSQRPVSRSTFNYDLESMVDRVIDSISATYESAITKGEGQYLSTIGFVDLLLQVVLADRHSSCRKRYRHYTESPIVWESDEDSLREHVFELGIEVKTLEVQISEVIRQISLYRSYSHIDRWILATTYPLNQPQVDCLASARITHLHLGDRFQTFVKQQANSPRSNSLEV